jgi:hypothetical protein
VQKKLWRISKMKEKLTKLYTISPAAGKRLIAKSILCIPEVLEALENRTVVIVAGTTNAYLAEEVCHKLGQSEGFSKKRFFRGVTIPSNYKKEDAGSSSEENKFLGDMVIVKGTWEVGKTIFDAVEQLKEGDIIFKGANAVNLEDRQAAVLIGHPAGGTIIPIVQTNIGKRVELYVPVGLEKRVTANINEMAALLNSADASGPRYMPVSGKIITELHAVKLLTGADASLAASGGICGAEGSYWLAVTGTEDELLVMDQLYADLKKEENFLI